MEYFGSLFCRSLILFASYRSGFGQRFEYDSELQLVEIDGMEDKRWEFVFLSRHRHSNRFIFRDDELAEICDGAFLSTEVEIVEAFNRVIRFSLLRRTKKLTINLLFVMKISAQAFYDDIRSRQSSDYGPMYPVDKLFQYLLEPYEPLNNEERLQLFAQSAEFYLKNLSPEWFPDQKTINFSTYGKQHPNHLVLLSETFNISERIGLNTSMYVLCSVNIITHYFIVLFHDIDSAANFCTSVASHLNDQIPCSTDWLSPEILQKINLPR